MRGLAKKRPEEERLNALVEEALLRKATGSSYTQQDSYKLKTVEYSDAGKKIKETEEVRVVDVEKYMPPEYSAIALWLKARMPQKWGEAAQAVLPEPVVIVDDIPAQLGGVSVKTDGICDTDAEDAAQQRGDAQC